MSKKPRQTLKVHRNDPCPCNSGKKYKHCCQPQHDQAKLKTKQLAIATKLQKLSPDQEIQISQPEDLGVEKMSDIIIDYASELLDLTQTPEENETIIMLAIIAWNIALLDEEEQQKEIGNFLNKRLKLKKNSKDWKQITDILQMLVAKKVAEYPTINRFIVSYDIVKSKIGFDINIMSLLKDDDVEGNTK